MSRRLIIEPRDKIAPRKIQQSVIVPSSQFGIEQVTAMLLAGALIGVAVVLGSIIL